MLSLRFFVLLYFKGRWSLSENLKNKIKRKICRCVAPWFLVNMNPQYAAVNNFYFSRNLNKNWGLLMAINLSLHHKIHTVPLHHNANSFHSLTPLGDERTRSWPFFTKKHKPPHARHRIIQPTDTLFLTTTWHLKDTDLYHVRTGSTVWAAHLQNGSSFQCSVYV